MKVKGIWYAPYFIRVHQGGAWIDASVKCWLLKQRSGYDRLAIRITRGPRAEVMPSLISVIHKRLRPC